MSRNQPRDRTTNPLPNILSFSRILLGVALFLLLPRGEPVRTAVCLGIVLLSTATDYLDGQIARRTRSVSLFGKWIDPLSDFTFFLFVYLAFYKIGLMPLVLLVLFLAREITMYGVIRPLYMIRKLDPGAKAAGKAKTVLQIGGSITLVFLLLLAQLDRFSMSLLERLSPWVFACLIAVSVASLIWYVAPLLRAPRAR
jgi:CDP-diacylglycerol--glycerol-3-phosphate 3-phosphatidyltransferase